MVGPCGLGVGGVVADTAQTNVQPESLQAYMQPSTGTSKAALLSSGAALQNQVIETVTPQQISDITICA